MLQFVDRWVYYGLRLLARNERHFGPRGFSQQEGPTVGRIRNPTCMQVFTVELKHLVIKYMICLDEVLLQY